MHACVYVCVSLCVHVREGGWGEYDSCSLLSKTESLVSSEKMPLLCEL